MSSEVGREAWKGHARVRWLYVRGLGLTFCIAFASLLPQLSGLMGPQGLEPAAAWLEWARLELGPVRFLRLPTLLWRVGAGDGGLWAVGLAGLVCGALAVADVAPRWALLGAYWKRRELGPYCPPLTLEGGPLRRADLPAGR